MSVTKPPCKVDGIECPRRYIGCRAECEAWHEWLALHEQERDQIREKKRMSTTVDAFLIEHRKRMTGRNPGQM